MPRCCNDVRCRGCLCGRALAGLAIAAMIVTSAPGATPEHGSLSAAVDSIIAAPPSDTASSPAVSVRVVPLELGRHPASAFGD